LISSAMAALGSVRDSAQSVRVVASLHIGGSQCLSYALSSAKASVRHRNVSRLLGDRGSWIADRGSTRISPAIGDMKHLLAGISSAPDAYSLCSRMKATLALSY